MKPEVLTCDNVPKPLHGTAPRTIFGAKWWDETRQAAYASTDYHCIACWCPKEDAYKKQLHAHEYYDINYAIGEVTVKAIIPLCPTCHDFIHSGRLLKLVEKGQYSAASGKAIMERGCALLMANDLDPSFSTILNMQEMSNMIDFDMKIFEWVLSYDIDEPEMASWGEWHYLIEGEKYYGKWKDFDEWNAYYSMH